MQKCIPGCCVSGAGRAGPSGTPDMYEVREPRHAQASTQNAIWYLSAFRSWLEACVDEPLPCMIRSSWPSMSKNWMRLHVGRRVDDAPKSVAERNQSALPDQRTATLALFECGASVPLMVTR